jgi:hypothetical protein
MNDYDKYLKYKKKYISLKQQGGATIYNLMKIINDSITNETFMQDMPIDPFIMDHAMKLLDRNVPYKISNYIDVINKSTIYTVFSNIENNFKYIQLRFPTLTLTDSSKQTTLEISNFYLCKFIYVLPEIINETIYNVFWLVEINGKSNKMTVYKLLINIPSQL